MKRFFLLFLTLVVLLSPSCMTIASRDNAANSTFLPPVPHHLSRNISFSLDMRDNYDGDAQMLWYDEMDMRERIRGQLKSCGLFDSVYYADLERASAHHLHFNLEMSGTSRETKSLLGVFCCTIPTWLEMDLNASASVLINGREIDCYHTKHVARDLIWLPLIVASPFCNHATTGRSLFTDSVDELLQQVKANQQ